MANMPHTFENIIYSAVVVYNVLCQVKVVAGIVQTSISFLILFFVCFVVLAGTERGILTCLSMTSLSFRLMC